MTDTAMQIHGVKASAATALTRTQTAKLTLDSPPEDWIMAESQIKIAKAFLAELSVAFYEAFTERLIQRGSIPIGDGRKWCPAKEKVTTCSVKGQEMLGLLMTELGGDLDAMKRCLSNGAKTWKPSEIKELAPGLYAKLFTTVEKTKAKSNEPKRKAATTR